MRPKRQTGSVHAVLAQIALKGAVTMQDVDANTETILEWMDRAIAGFPGCDIVIFPECCFHGDGPNYVATGLTLESEQVRRVCDKCRELEVWGVFNPWILSEDGRSVANVGIIVNDKGEIVHTYTKLEPMAPGETTYPGKGFTTCDGPQGTKIAFIICNDANFLDVWKEIAESDADWIIHVSHWMAPYEYSHKLTNCAGAYFTQLPLVAVNSAGKDGSQIYCGNSMYVNPYGKIVAEAPLGIEWLMDAWVNPGEFTAAIYNTGRVFEWEGRHRGASCPSLDGNGYDDSAFTYKK